MTIIVNPDPSGNVTISSPLVGDVVVPCYVPGQVQVTAAITGSLTINGYVQTSVQISGTVSGTVHVRGYVANSLAVTQAIGGSLLVDGYIGVSLTVQAQIVGSVLVGGEVSSTTITSSVGGNVSLGSLPDFLTLIAGNRFLRTNERKANTAWLYTGTGAVSDATALAEWTSSSPKDMAVAVDGVVTAMPGGSSVVLSATMPVSRLSDSVTLSFTAGYLNPSLDGGGLEGHWSGAGGGMSGKSLVFMCCVDWPTLLYWDRTSATATPVTGSPLHVNSIAWHNGHMYALSGNVLWFSDASDPFTWPSTNQIILGLGQGLPRYLKSTQDRLYIYCTNGVMFLTGSPPDNVFVGTLVTNLPCTKGNVAHDGGTAIYISYDNVITLSGGATILSNALPGLSLQMTPYVRLAASPEYLFIRSQDMDGSTLLYVYDRTKYGTWSRWRYPTTTALGNYATGRYFPVCHGVTQQRKGVFLPGDDGNIYFQPLLSAASQVYHPLSPGDTFSDYPGVPVVNRLSTRFTSIVDDRIVQKQLRAFTLQGTGSNLAVTMNYMKPDGTVVAQPVPLDSSTLPAEQSLTLTGEGAVPVGGWTEAQMEIQGQGLNLRELSWTWRTVRYGGRQL